MILVDSSVWIDFFRNRPTAQVEWLDAHLAAERLVIGDLILAEVLQGFRQDRAFDEARRLLSRLQPLVLAGEAIAVEAARNFRRLRVAGVTVRSMVDTVIATRCIAEGMTLLHSDRDFDPFEAHLGLRVVKCAA